jgi:RNA polymerase sigma-70 factor (ECF subfamily)
MTSSLPTPPPPRLSPESAWLGHLYQELHSIAERCFRAERTSHTLQPTALVHEAMLRLSGYTAKPEEPAPKDENLLALAAVVMRRVLVDHARRRRVRDPHRERTLLPLPSAGLADSRSHIDIMVFDEMLSRFERVDARASRVIELRFFGGLTITQVAALMNQSVSTVESDSRFALAWMRRDLAPEDITYQGE